MTREAMDAALTARGMTADRGIWRYARGLVSVDVQPDGARWWVGIRFAAPVAALASGARRFDAADLLGVVDAHLAVANYLGPRLTATTTRGEWLAMMAERRRTAGGTR